MKIGVIGGGRVGSALAASWRDKGHDVAVSTRETVEETAAQADVVVSRCPPPRSLKRSAETGSLEGKVLLDATNNVSGGPSGLEIAALVPEAPYVKAFNTIFATFMHETPPNAGAACLYCGDDARAKGVAAQLIQDVGLDPSTSVGPRPHRGSRGSCGSFIALAYRQGRGPFVYRFEPS